MTTSTTPETSSDIVQYPFDSMAEINVELSEFVPLTNKITDAAANLIAKADKRLHDDKNTIYGANRERLYTAILAAKQIVKISDDMNQRLRVTHATADSEADNDE